MFRLAGSGVRAWLDQADAAEAIVQAIDCTIVREAEIIDGDCDGESASGF
jgi:hypothetical protein